MRTVIQRVKKASVRVGESEVSSIGPGLLLLLGIEAADTEEDILWLCHKILGLRIFDDEEGVMNKSIMDVNGEAIVVSQFTLYASYKKGNRVGYVLQAMNMQFLCTKGSSKYSAKDLESLLERVFSERRCRSNSSTTDP